MTVISPQIGILAGMGPRSTAPFIDAVVTQCQHIYGAVLDEDFPKMMILSLPTPFYVDRPIDHQKMKATIAEGLRNLEAAGSDFISMPCNSAHAYYNELRQAVGIPLLNIIEETLNRLDGGHVTTVLATRVTMESRLYQDGIEKVDLEYRFKPEWQESVDKVVSAIKSGKIRETAAQVWAKLLSELQKAEVQQAIVACTDINAILPVCPTDILFVDSTHCLAEATVTKYVDLKE